MKEFIFNRNDYKSYKDMYEDIAHKTGSDQIDDYFDNKTYNYDPNILWECLLDDFGYRKKLIKLIFVNFDREKIKLQKNYDDYEYNIIFTVFERFVKQYPNNKIEFRMEN